jgi:Fe-S-cluster containining protein
VITIFDAITLQEGLGTLPFAERDAVVGRAADQAAEMEAAYPALRQSPVVDQWSDAEIDRLVEQFHAMPCPALGDDGLCRLYEHRPLTCRSMGIPVEHGASTQGACSVQSFVPLVRLSASIRKEEEHLARQEADALERCRARTGVRGEEVLLPYGFLPPLAGRSPQRKDRRRTGS